MNPTESIHRQTWDLIPWIINQSASEEDLEAASIHLQTCQDCREEFALQSRIHARMNHDPMDDKDRARASLQGLMHRIDTDMELPEPVSTVFGAGGEAAGASRGRRRLLAGLAAAVVIQAIGLIGLGTIILQSRATTERAGNYSTLSAEAPLAPGATIRLVPSPNLSVGGLQQLLDEANLQIVGSHRGASILALAPDQSSADGGVSTDLEHDRHTREALQRLRGSPDILLAEPILSQARGR
ncbi:hypothetical protein [Dokdonella sp.]|uniref:hypothetical protein n=1 Tax=Dokdonella sp. TaxID=2291710 RepID=UPI003C5A8E08